MEDRDQLDVVARRGRGDLGQVRQRRDVAGLVEAQEQRPLEPAAGERRAFVGAVDDLAEQREEDRPQQLRRLGVADQVQRRACVEQPVGGDLACPAPSGRRARTGRPAAAPGRSPRSRSASGRPAPRTRAPRRTRRALELASSSRRRRARQRLVEFARPLAVDPPDDRVHARPADRGGVQQRREPLLGGDRPEVAALDARAGRARRPQASRHATSSAPSQVCALVRAATTCAPRTPESPNGSNTNTSPERAAARDRGGQQVGLDRARDRRTVPLEQRRDRDARRTCPTAADRTRPARAGARRTAAARRGARARAAAGSATARTHAAGAARRRSAHLAPAPAADKPPAARQQITLSPAAAGREQRQRAVEPAGARETRAAAAGHAAAGSDSRDGRRTSTPSSWSDPTRGQPGRTRRRPGRPTATPSRPRRRAADQRRASRCPRPSGDAASSPTQPPRRSPASRCRCS